MWSFFVFEVDGYIVWEVDDPRWANNCRGWAQYRIFNPSSELHADSLVDVPATSPFERSSMSRLSVFAVICRSSGYKVTGHDSSPNGKVVPYDVYTAKEEVLLNIDLMDKQVDLHMTHRVMPQTLYPAETAFLRRLFSQPYTKPTVSKTLCTL